MTLMEQRRKNLAKLYDGVLTGLGGMVWHGTTNIGLNFLDIAVENKKLDGLRMAGAEYTYVENLDKNNFLKPYKHNPRLIIPTLERSIVDYLRHDMVDKEDENLMIALQDYEYRMKGNFSELLKVADFYNVREQMIKAIELSKDWDSEY